MASKTREASLVLASMRPLHRVAEMPSLAALFSHNVHSAHRKQSPRRRSLLKKKKCDMTQRNFLCCSAVSAFPHTALQSSSSPTGPPQCEKMKRRASVRRKCSPPLGCFQTFRQKQVKLKKTRHLAMTQQRVSERKQRAHTRPSASMTPTLPALCSGDCALSPKHTHACTHTHKHTSVFFQKSCIV